MTYVVEFVALGEGADPVSLREEINTEIEARMRYQELVQTRQKFIAFKLCLNDASQRRWQNPIFYLDSMKKSVTDIVKKRDRQNIEGSELTIYFVRVCDQEVEQCRISLDSELLATDLHLSMEQDSEDNDHVDAYAVVLVHNHSRLRLQHVHYKGLKLLRKTIPNEKLGGYSWDELKRAKKWLFR